MITKHVFRNWPRRIVVIVLTIILLASSSPVVNAVSQKMTISRIDVLQRKSAGIPIVQLTGIHGYPVFFSQSARIVGCDHNESDTNTAVQSSPMCPITGCCT